MKNFSNPDGLVREDFKGGWPGDSVNKFSRGGRSVKENEAFDYVKKLANYRKSSAALQTGKLMQYIPRHGVYVYFRYNDSNSVMVLYNSTDKEAQVATTDYNERLRGFNSAVQVVDNQLISDLATLAVPAKSTLVLELKK
jgi:glycosidase